MRYIGSMAKWQQTVDLKTLEQRGQLVYKNPDGRHQLALFHHQGQCYAVDNRCPHEGYPLSQGSVDNSCILTCNWHNWKFTLKEGRNLYGGDGLRTYPVEVRGEQVWVDFADPPREQVQALVLDGLRRAVADEDHGWIARELARLHVAEIDPRIGVRQTLVERLSRLEYGTTHCLAATADWLAFYDERRADGSVEDQLICLTEAIEHIAHDTLREQEYPFPQPRTGAFDPQALLRELEAEDADAAIARARGAVRQGVPYRTIRPVLARAALSHYTGFGHGLIYVLKGGQVIDTLGPDVADVVVSAVTRYLAYATREDLIPEFRDYAKFVAQMPEDFGEGTRPPDSSTLIGAPLSTVLGWVCQQAASHRPEAVFDALLQALAINMLRFDTAHSFSASVKVANNVDWLDLTHGLTFANALHTISTHTPELWGPGLLQMGCFLARNRRYLAAQPDESWGVEDADTFFAAARAQILDHGLGLPIHACHLLKTTFAVEVEFASASEPCRAAVLAALNRFLHAPLKQKHVRRNVHQALALIAG